MVRSVCKLVTGVLVGCVLVGSTHAQTLPGPDVRPAPGNEKPAIPPNVAGYQPAVNYQLECSGCHLTDGEGSRANDVPRMKNFVGHFLDVEGGRAFLARVPGVAQSSYTDMQLAELLNWILTDGIAGSSTPADFQPYTADEVARYRKDPLDTIAPTRELLLERMQVNGITINDGLEDRP